MKGIANFCFIIIYLFCFGWSSFACNNVLVYSSEVNADGISYSLKENKALKTVTIMGFRSSFFVPENYNLVIPETIKKIELVDEKLITTVYTVTGVGQDAFADDTNLMSVTLPKTIIEIGDNAFLRCENLKTVTISQGISKIGYNAFCFSGLTSVTIPNSVISIDHYAFYGCSFLEKVIIEKSASFGFDGISAGEYIFGMNTEQPFTNENFSIFVPDLTSEGLYKAASNWNEYSEKLFSK